MARHLQHHRARTRVGVIGLCPNVLPDNAYARAYGSTRDRLFRAQAYAFPPEHTGATTRDPDQGKRWEQG